MEETVGHGLGGLGVQIVWMGVSAVVYGIDAVVGLARTVLSEGAVDGGEVLDRLVLGDVVVNGGAFCSTSARGGRV